MPGYSDSQLDELISRTYKNISSDVEHLAIHEAWMRLEEKLPGTPADAPTGASADTLAGAPAHAHAGASANTHTVPAAIPAAASPAKSTKTGRWRLPFLRVAAVVLSLVVVTGVFAVIFPNQSKDFMMSLQTEKESREMAPPPAPSPEGVMLRKMVCADDNAGAAIEPAEGTAADALADNLAAASDAGDAVIFSAAAPIKDMPDTKVRVFNSDMLCAGEPTETTVLQKESQSTPGKRDTSIVEQVTLEQAIAGAPFKIGLPDYLPENLVLDYVLLDVPETQANSKCAHAIVTLVYVSNDSESPEHLCIKQQNYIDETTKEYLAREDSVQTEAVEINGDTGKLTPFEEDYVNLFWVVSANRVVVNAEGKLSVDEMLKIANSMKP